MLRDFGRIWRECLATYHDAREYGDWLLHLLALLQILLGKVTEEDRYSLTEGASYDE